MGLNVCKTMSMSLAEVTEFEKWIKKFEDRAYDKPGYVDMDDVGKNIGRAMKRKYGYPEYWITGSNNMWTMNLGYQAN